MMSQPWRVELLGGFSLVRGSERITHFRTRKAAALLAYLTLHPQHHSRDSLIDLLWPDADFDAARGSFRVALSHLRKALGDDFLHASRDTVGIAAPFTCDAADFAQAVRAKRWTDAARLYPGELLPGFWDDWVVAERGRLAALFETVQENGADRAAPPTVFLPPEANRFFGREDEIGQAATLLTEHRLVTLLGPGGVGKTRLAVAAARCHAALFPGGIWFVSLAEVTDADRLLSTVRDTLGLPRDPRAQPLEQIADRLTGDLPCLLVLDNLEQIAAAGAPVLASLLPRIPNLTCLATSRRHLGVPGERRMSVAPLAESPSIALFCDRAQTVVRDEETAGLCRDLEGVPLAIELCAARAGVFTVAEMRKKLAEPFTLLTSTASEKTSRHRSLYAAIEWSYRLLTPEQRRFFTRLSVFRGGWTREGAEAVCGEPYASEYLAQLRERSLVTSDASGGQMRFRLLETLRTFAREQLTEGERTALRQRHADYFLAFAAERSAEMDGASSANALDRLEAEHDNFRAALDHAENDQALRLIGEIWKFWEIRGHFTEGRRRIVEALARTDAAQPDDTRARALSALGTLAYTQGDHEAALTVQTEAVGMAQDASVAAKARNNLALTLLRTGRLEEAEQVFEAARADFVALGNRAAEAATLSNLGIVRRRRGDLVGARAALETAIQRNREAQSSQSLAFALNGLALVLIQMRCLDEAETCFAESLEIKRRLNDRAGVVSALANMGLLAAEQGRFARAVTLQREALALRIELGLQHGILESLSGFSLLAHAAGDSARAATLLGAQTAFGEKIGTPVPPEERADAETALRTALPESDFKNAFARGEAMTIAEATAFAAAFRPTDANGCPRL